MSVKKKEWKPTLEQRINALEQGIIQDILRLDGALQIIHRVQEIIKEDRK
jgi:hypothetical protein